MKRALETDGVPAPSKFDPVHYEGGTQELREVSLTLFKARMRIAKLEAENERLRERLYERARQIHELTPKGPWART